MEERRDEGESTKEGTGAWTPKPGRTPGRIGRRREAAQLLNVMRLNSWRRPAAHRNGGMRSRAAGAAGSMDGRDGTTGTRIMEEEDSEVRQHAGTHRTATRGSAAAERDEVEQLAAPDDVTKR